MACTSVGEIGEPSFSAGEGNFVSVDQIGDGIWIVRPSVAILARFGAVSSAAVSVLLQGVAGALSGGVLRFDLEIMAFVN